MKATYRLGKQVSKYIICDILGFAGPRQEVGQLLMGASSMLRTLLQREFDIFLANTEERQILELWKVHINYRDGWKEIPNLFCPAAFDRPLKVDYSLLKGNEKYWGWLTWVHTLVIDKTVTGQELHHILHCLKP